MEDFLDESVSEEDLRKFERRYHDALAKGTVTNTIQFEYAWCLIRSKYPTDIKRGIFLLEDLLKSGSESARRDCLYYLAIGHFIPFLLTKLPRDRFSLFHFPFCRVRTLSSPFSRFIDPYRLCPLTRPFRLTQKSCSCLCCLFSFPPQCH